MHAQSNRAHAMPKLLTMVTCDSFRSPFFIFGIGWMSTKINSSLFFAMHGDQNILRISCKPNGLKAEERERDRKREIDKKRWEKMVSIKDLDFIFFCALPFRSIQVAIRVEKSEQFSEMHTDMIYTLVCSGYFAPTIIAQCSFLFF